MTMTTRTRHRLHRDGDDVHEDDYYDDGNDNDDSYQDDDANHSQSSSDDDDDDESNDNDDDDSQPDDDESSFDGRPKENQSKNPLSRELSQHVLAAVLAIAAAVVAHARLHGGFSSWKDELARDWRSLWRTAGRGEDILYEERFVSASVPRVADVTAGRAAPVVHIPPSPSMNDIPAEQRRRLLDRTYRPSGRDRVGGFRRTAGLTFCRDDGAGGDSMEWESPPNEQGDVNGLKDMEFVLPLHPSVAVLHACYLSDALALDSNLPYAPFDSNGRSFYRSGSAPLRSLGRYGDDAILNEIDEWMDSSMDSTMDSSSSSLAPLQSILERYLPRTSVDRQHLCLLRQYAHHRSSHRSLRGTIRVYRRPHVSTYFRDAWIRLANGNDDSHNETTPPSVRPPPDYKIPPASLTFTGFAAKFVNLSPRPVHLYWDHDLSYSTSSSQSSHFVGTIPPMEAIGTATFPGHSFRLTPTYDASHVLKRWTVTEDQPVLLYDPLEDLSNEKQKLAMEGWKRDERWNDEWAFQRDAWTVDRSFGRDYLIETKRVWLAHFPLVPLDSTSFLGTVGVGDKSGGAMELSRNSIVPMWRADYIGQTHVVSTSQWYFQSLPETLSSLTREDYRPDVDDARRLELQRHRTPVLSKRKQEATTDIASDTASDTHTTTNNNHNQTNTHTNLTLRVLSISPRILEIPKFLSPLEVQHLIDLAAGPSSSVPMERSTVSSSGDPSVRGATKPDTRSSTGGWIHREHDVVVDAVFRRVADALGVDETRFRDRNGVDGDPFEKHPPNNDRLPTDDRIVEAMQLLRYGPGEEYAAHHDFTYPSVANRYQPRRVATMLLYLTGEGDFLDERGVRRRSSSSADSSSSSVSSSSFPPERSPLRGGDTVFPRAITTQFHDGVRVKPQSGKAVLFYNVLPDGNMDDLSQHAGGKVESGVKYLANIWVWDPIIN